MGFELFRDLIDTLGKVLSGIKKLADLPKAEREKYRQTMSETYRLLDTTLNMVIIRLGDILLLSNPNDFRSEAEQLDNYNGWLNAEREFRLCQSLRVALRETENLRDRLVGKVSVEDWDSLIGMMGAAIAAEGELAYFISQRFTTLAESARTGSDNVETLQREVRSLRNRLVAERQNLIQQEIELYDII